MAGDIGPLLYRGAQEICSAVGINYKEIVYFVKEKKLPAWKIDGKGPWLATKADLLAWIDQQRAENIGRTD